MNVSSLVYFACAFRRADNSAMYHRIHRCKRVARPKAGDRKPSRVGTYFLARAVLYKLPISQHSAIIRRAMYQSIECRAFCLLGDSKFFHANTRYRRTQVCTDGVGGTGRACRCTRSIRVRPAGFRCTGTCRAEDQIASRTFIFTSRTCGTTSIVSVPILIPISPPMFISDVAPTVIRFDYRSLSVLTSSTTRSFPPRIRSGCTRHTCCVLVVRCRVIRIFPTWTLAAIIPAHTRTLARTATYTRCRALSVLIRSCGTPHTRRASR